MALRLAGEEFSVVQGLDEQGFVKEVRAEGPGNWNLGWYASALWLTTRSNNRIVFGINGVEKASIETDGAVKGIKLRTANFVLKEYVDGLSLLNATETGNKDLLCNIVLGNLSSASSEGKIYTNPADNSRILLQAKDTGVGLVEVARLQGAADPYFQASMVRYYPGSAPGSPVEGWVYYDSTAKKLKVYTGTAWETISSS